MTSVDISRQWPELGLPGQVADLLIHSKSVYFPEGREELLSMAVGGENKGLFKVGYDVPGRGWIARGYGC